MPLPGGGEVEHRETGERAPDGLCDRGDVVPQEGLAAVRFTQRRDGTGRSRSWTSAGVGSRPFGFCQMKHAWQRQSQRSVSASVILNGRREPSLVAAAESARPR